MTNVLRAAVDPVRLVRDSGARVGIGASPVRVHRAHPGAHAFRRGYAGDTREHILPRRGADFDLDDLLRVRPSTVERIAESRELGTKIGRTRNESARSADVGVALAAAYAYGDQTSAAHLDVALSHRKVDAYFALAERLVVGVPER